MTVNQDASKLSKAESARINGGKSQGPVSDEGKLNSANGPLKHGAYSKRILMDGESVEFYEYFKATFQNLFQPADPFEAECVESMVSARWRIRRLESSEARNLNIALATNREATAARFDAIDILHERAVTVQAQLPSIDTHTRVEERLHRIYDRNYRLLAAYRKTSGRHIPSQQDLHGSDSPKPDPDTPPPAPTTPGLAEEPNSKPGVVSSNVSITSQIAVFFVLFAILLLTPFKTFSETLAIGRAVSAFHAPASPSAPAMISK